MNPETLATPEPKWLFRRIMTFLFTALTAAGVAYVIHALAHAQAIGPLERIAWILLVNQLVVVVIYLVAPTAEYVGRVAELVKAAKGP